jgi:16S rRNA G966 N2-methylase RsmD
LPRFCHWPAGSAAAAGGAVVAGSAADAALVIFALWIRTLNCRGRAFSALISSFKYLDPPFHNQTAGLSMMYMNTTRNKANRLNYESFILFHIRKHHRPLKASTW